MENEKTVFSCGCWSCFLQAIGLLGLIALWNYRDVVFSLIFRA